MKPNGIVIPLDRTARGRVLRKLLSDRKVQCRRLRSVLHKLRRQVVSDGRRLYVVAFSEDVARVLSIALDRR